MIRYYWKLFVDFDALKQRGLTPQVFTYGKGAASVSDNNAAKQEKEIQTSVKTSNRDAVAQKRYRDKLLEECPYCPITKISDERLLVASHIKPYSVSEDDEAFDPKNGFILSPLYDRLFDQGFISFDEKKCMLVSNWISPTNQAKCNIKTGSYIQALPLDDEREKYMEYHRQYVFKG
jgi:predicted restriction endonuclease